ncbi:hypothetical protein RI129_008629 [Pyrocoelia pectoralis]|uniref:O-acyltransferase WSD1 C-terminal domain-containing protein n=1 Tax=Pyrocoelia pectoralis TaxID=417401 RepID=A0AAN7V7N5_9COLE
MMECKAVQKRDEVYEMYKNVIERAFFSNRNKLSDLHCAVRRFGGYSYKLKANPTIEECVRKMDIVKCQNDMMHKNELKKLLSKCCNHQLPKNNTLFWDTLIGTQPVDWNREGNNSASYHPVLFRLHHAICDGFGITQLLSVMLDKIPYENQDSLESHLEKAKEGSPFKTVLHQIVATLYAVVFNISDILLAVLQTEEPNAFRGTTLSNDEIFTMKVDNGEYFRKVKHIKSDLPHASFSGIILTAFSASFKEYFDTHVHDCPERINLIVPYLRKTTSLSRLPQIDADHVSLQNSFVMFVLDFPLITKNNQLLERLNLVQACALRSSTSVGSKTVYYWSKIALQVFPMFLLALADDLLQATTVLSILPGPGPVSLAGGKMKIRNALFWIPLVAKMGKNPLLYSIYSSSVHSAKFHSDQLF